MDLIAIVTITVLMIMGSFHLYWAFGGKVGLDKALPTKDGKRLIDPGKTLTLFVGVILLGFSYVAYSLHFNEINTDYIVYIGWIISALFFIRAIGEFNAIGFFKKIRSTEFAKYDTRFFSPLCLYLGVVFAILSSQV